MKRNMLTLLLALFETGAAFSAPLSGIAVTPEPTLHSGFYRFAIQRQDGKEIAFISEVKDSGGKKIVYIINGKDKLSADEISFHKDSITIKLPFFGSSLIAKIKDNGDLAGNWIRNYGKRKQVLPFTAVYKQTERFKATVRPAQNITGRWAVQFTGRGKKINEAVGEFIQQGSHLSGTFRTSTGDYRFLEGVVSGDSLYLSGFDGAGAKLFVAAIEDAQTISGGKYYSGGFSSQNWTARKDDNTSLPDEFAVTKLRPGATKPDFSFRDLDGNTVSIKDARFQNKVTVIQIMGSWCPNCMDEARFVAENYEEFSKKGVEFIALAYELSSDYEESKTALQPFVKRFKINYPVLITGVSVSDTLRTEKTLPQLEKIKAFPTTLFLDKKGNIRKIHTGFDGPATGDHYVQYKKEFEEIISTLSKE